MWTWKLSSAAAMISATAKHTPEMPYSRATSANDQPASAGTRRKSTTTTPNSVTQARNEPISARMKDTLYCIWLRNCAPTSLR